MPNTYGEQKPFVASNLKIQNFTFKGSPKGLLFYFIADLDFFKIFWPRAREYIKYFQKIAAKA